jgi:hypothetical protein
MWIGFLYAIMCLSLNLKSLIIGKEQNIFDDLAQRDPKEIITMFREKTIQCLTLGDYTKPTTYTVETMLTYYLSDYFTIPDGHIGGWMVLGLAIRAAMRLGYHRDPSNYPNMSPLRGEMQRRVWCVLVHLDIATSGSVGLPRMVSTDLS